MATDLREVLVQVGSDLMRSHGLPSRELRGVIDRRTIKAIHFVGKASTRATASCLRCGHRFDGTPPSTGYHPQCILATLDAEVALWLPAAKVNLHPVNQPVTTPQVDAAEALPVLVRVEGRMITVRSHFMHASRCKSIPNASWQSAHRRWAYPASPVTAEAIMSAFVGYTLDTDDAFKILIAKAERSAEAEQYRDADDLPNIPGLKTDAWIWQRRAFWFSDSLPATMLAMGMGLGKSLVAVGKVARVASGPGDITLIVCPKAVTDVWPREFRVHADYPVDVVQVVSKSGRVKGSLDKRLADAKTAVAFNQARGVPTVLVLTYDIVWRDNIAKWLSSMTYKLIALDESHKIKTPTAKASVAMYKLAPLAENRMCLTGTPLANSPLDVYGQYRFLDPGIFGTSFSRFKSRYALFGGFQNHQVIGYQNQEELARKIYSIAFKVGDEVQNLPEPIEAAPWMAPMGGEGLRLYKAISDDLFAMREGRDGVAEFTAANVLTKLIRQQQLTGGHITDDSGVTHQVGTAKRELLEDLFEDMTPGEPVVIFARFTADLQAIREVVEAKGLRYGELSGARGDALNADAKMAEDIDVAGVQIQSGGMGVDFTRARYCVFYSLGFSLTDYLQARKRIHRPGQEKTITYYYLVISNVDIDKKVYRALSLKQDVVSFVMDNLGVEVEVEDDVMDAAFLDEGEEG